MKFYHRPSNYLMKWKFFLAILPVLVLARVALASDSVDPSDPNAQYTYTCPPQPIPNFDCTNFVIDNTLTINFQTLSTSTLYFEPWNTLNYTNNGTMMDNTGFKFDTQLSSSYQHVMAGTFYNAGDITAGSLFDLTGIIFNLSGLIGGYGQIYISATNIINPGTLDVGVNGGIKMIGQNVDLSDSTLTVESLVASNSIYNVPTFNSYGVTALDTNGDWDPYIALQPTTAFSPPLAPQYISQMYITNATPYVDIKVTNPTNIIYRAIIIQNASTNVPYKIYFEGINNGSPLDFFGIGAAHVEWDGTYLDPSSGNYFTNYLYLTDDYVGSASTNNPIFGGIPNNFSFVTSYTPLINNINPTAPGFVLFPDQLFTNRYAYMNGQLVPGTAVTNANSSNPSGSVTNIAGRIQISASNTLNMAQAIISGPNYMSIICTNQFNGSPGASIATPYSDVSLGVTNGFLTVSNLLMASIPQWSGTIQAWSTRLVYTDTNGITQDYRVMLVYDNLQPTTPPWIQNLRLHATNSLVISDVLNIYGNTVYADAQSVTLATNVVGTGATSLDGEFNLCSGATLSTTQFPDLVWLTNNGAIRCYNNANFTNLYTGFTYYSTNYTYSTNSVTQAVKTNASVALVSLPQNWLGAFINNSLVTNQAMSVSALNFTNNGGINTGSGTFGLQSSSANFVNGYTLAGSDVAINGTNLFLAGEFINAGRALNLLGVQSVSDGETNLVANGLTNGNVWVVGALGIGGADSGFNASFNPLSGDLLGTTVTNIAPGGKNIVNTWAGVNRGISVAGYSNNLAVGHLVLDSLVSGSRNGTFTFNGAGGAGVTNAIYVDCLELRDYATNRDVGYNPTALKFATNFVIYYAQAYINGLSVAEKINHKGIDVNGVSNSDHLRWVPSYAGYYSYTNLVYPDGTTNVVNLALAQSTDISSGGNLSSGNAGNPTQIFVPSQIGLSITLTNKTTRRLAFTIPATATNYFVQYKTNLLTSAWTLLTNSSVNNAAGTIPLTQTNVYFLDTNSGPMRFYQVVEQPWLTYPQ